MDRRSLGYFIAIAERHNLTRAAELLHVTQPALSRAMKALEREVGAPLFRRTARGVVLTDVGEDLYRRGRKVAAEFDALVPGVAGSTAVTGEVRVAFAVPLTEALATTILAQVFAEHPGIRVRASGAYETRDVMGGLMSGVSDIAIVGDEARPVVPGLHVEPLLDEEVVVAVPWDSPLAGLDRIPPSALRDRLFIAEPSSPLRRLLDRLVERDGARIAIDLSFRQPMLPLVELGTALAVLPESLVRLNGRPGVVARGFDPPLRMPVWMITRPELTPAGIVLADVTRNIAATIRDAKKTLDE